MTMVWISAFEQPVTNEKDAIQAGLEGSEHYLDRIMELLPTTEEARFK